ncbi:FGGY-family carbohydrate kinase [Halococcus salifodinae]|uniref:L-xylulose kinase protein n=1 Tax=Halococcus salifodinae DSM 8989 TaxID=1227456 RepID=M0N9P4_9EURY|nr:FGGY family carbohydrate kinase [Halococcus salifodinae]EMA54298.1 L-xylulose kinase protein [Halococcus salifodinae DSM 8989]
MTENVLVGVDAGLTNVTVAAYDPDGTELAAASRSTPRSEPDGAAGEAGGTGGTANGGVDASEGAAADREEQDHDRLWAVVAETVGAVVGSDDVPTDAVAGVGVAGHGHGLYGLDAAGEPVCGIKSTDSRALDALDEHCAEGARERAVDRLGWEPFGADPLSLLVWLRANEPATYDRLDTLLFCKDVLTHRLTGERVTDPTEGSVFYGPNAAYDREAFAALGIEAAFKALPPVIPSTESCGAMTVEAAADTGLPEGTPVAAGLQDVGACTFGAGLVEPGDGLAILGTWGQSVAVLDSPDDGAGGLLRRYLDGWYRYRGIRAGAACVDWFVDRCGGDWRREACERGVDPYEVYEEAVAGVDPGADGLVFHPFLQGSTDDPSSAGGFYGLRLSHTSAHMLRAIYEGVAITQTGALDTLTPAVGTIRLTGGGAQSDAWSKLFADVADAPVTVPDARETGALGAALCGGTAAGVYPDAATAVDRAVGTAQSYEPDSAAVAAYRRVSEAFDQAVDGMEVPWETLKTFRRED